MRQYVAAGGCSWGIETAVTYSPGAAHVLLLRDSPPPAATYCRAYFYASQARRAERNGGGSPPNAGTRAAARARGSPNPKRGSLVARARRARASRAKRAKGKQSSSPPDRTRAAARERGSPNPKRGKLGGNGIVAAFRYRVQRSPKGERPAPRAARRKARARAGLVSWSYGYRVLMLLVQRAGQPRPLA